MKDKPIFGVDQISKRGKRFRPRSHIFRSDFPATILSDSSAPEELVSLVMRSDCLLAVQHLCHIRASRSAIYLGPAIGMAEIVRHPDMPRASMVLWLQILIWRLHLECFGSRCSTSIRKGQPHSSWHHHATTCETFKALITIILHSCRSSSIHFHDAFRQLRQGREDEDRC